MNERGNTIRNKENKENEVFIKWNLKGHALPILNILNKHKCFFPSIEKRLKDGEDNRWVDLGCGTVDSIAHLKNEVGVKGYHGVDLNATTHTNTEENVHFHQAEMLSFVTKLPEESVSLYTTFGIEADLVCSSEENVKKYLHSLMLQMRRTLKPKGIIIAGSIANVEDSYLLNMYREVCEYAGFQKIPLSEFIYAEVATKYSGEELKNKIYFNKLIGKRNTIHIWEKKENFYKEKLEELKLRV